MNEIFKLFGFKDDDKITAEISSDDFKLFVNGDIDLELKSNGEFINYETTYYFRTMGRVGLKATKYNG